MKKIIAATFASRPDAERAIMHLRDDLSIPNDDISYIYRNTEGEVKEVEPDDIKDTSTAEGAVTGAQTGGVLGAIAGIVAVVAAIPAVGPIFVAGPLIAALGITGAAGTIAAGAATGVVAGGLLGALVNLGVSEDRAKEYEDRIHAGDVLIVVHADNSTEVSESLVKDGGYRVDVYTPTV